MSNNKDAITALAILVGILFVLVVVLTIVYSQPDKPLVVDITVKETQSLNMRHQTPQEDCTFYDGEVNGITYRNAICSPIPLKVYHKTIVYEEPTN